MEISIREISGVTVVDMDGSLDTRSLGYASEELNQLVKDGKTKLLLNLEQVNYVSSAGLRAILVAAKLVKTAWVR